MQEDAFKTFAIVNNNPESSAQNKTIFSRKNVILVLLLLSVISVFPISRFISKNNEFQAQQAEAAILVNTIPLENIESFGTYKGLEGGLYEGGANTPTLSQRIRIQKQISLIKPLLENGQEDSNGKVGFLFIGDPYTEGEFQAFSEVLLKEKKADHLVLVDGSQAAQDTTYWEKGLYPWEVLKDRVESAGIISTQVQVAWLDLNFSSYSGNLQVDIEDQARTLNDIIKITLSKYPNIRVIYLSSPRYAGYSIDSDYQEPQAFEAAFAVRHLISLQEESKLNYMDSVKLLKTEPALVWGPYLWNNQTNGGGNYAYGPERYEKDGITFNLIGKQKYALDLLNFWSEYEFSNTWFKASI